MVILFEAGLAGGAVWHAVTDEGRLPSPENPQSAPVAYRLRQVKVRRRTKIELLARKVEHQDVPSQILATETAGIRPRDRQIHMLKTAQGDPPQQAFLRDDSAPC